MAQGGSVHWRAVGASLNTLAQTMRNAHARTPAVLAHVNSALLQQVGVVVGARYVTAQNFAVQRPGGSGRLNYTAPPGATHGPVIRTHRREDGTYSRNARGQFVDIVEMRKLFIKGKFVSRTGEMREIAADLSAAHPRSTLGRIIVQGENPRNGGSGRVVVGITPEGNGYVDISGGYRAAEAGRKGTVSAGTRAWWKSIRSVQGRWKTLLRKRYPDLFQLLRRP